MPDSINLAEHEQGAKRVVLSNQLVETLLKIKHHSSKPIHERNIWQQH